MQAMQSFPVSSEEDPSQHRDLISQNPQPTIETIRYIINNVNYQSELLHTQACDDRNRRKK